MNHTTIEFQASKQDRAMKPIFGALAVLATVATLSLMVAGPAALSPSGHDLVLARSAPKAPVEVAIYPASIEVVGTRTQAARSGHSNLVPAVYHAR